jgi:UPF0716 protein FxsA
MLALLVGLLVVVPLVEIYLLIQVGQVIGAVPTVLLLVAMSVLGGVLLKREGTRTWRAFRTATQQGRMPATEVADGALVIFGGALLLTPGFATDAVGLLCVLPGSRAVVRRLLTALVANRLGLVGMAGTFAASRYRAHRTRVDEAGHRYEQGVVDGEVVDVEVVDGDEPPAPLR